MFGFIKNKYKLRVKSINICCEMYLCNACFFSLYLLFYVDFDRVFCLFCSIRNVGRKIERYKFV